MTKIIRLGAAAGLLLLLGILVSSAQTEIGAVPGPTPSLRPGYAGDGSCVGCHTTEATSYLHTAHHLTSQLPTTESVRGMFLAGGNTLTIVDPANDVGEPGLLFQMEARGNRFSEAAVTGFPPNFQRRTETIDIVTGSGKRGQTFLYWQGDRLFELPVSYWSDGNRLINSPGYPNGTADFARPIHPACMECHATYLQPLSADPSTNHFNRASFVPGISCETCHGAGAAHAESHAGKRGTTSKSPDETILNPARFSRDRQVELCALCHNGIQRESLAPAFSYIPGRQLAEFFKPIPSPVVEHPDVHGNQVGLLQRSRCYLSSPNMSCSTCHNTHAAEKPAASYSSVCLQCHQWTSCGVSKKLGHAIADNCIDCHMPIEPTKVISSETAGQVVRAKMRNHWIKIYSGSTDH